MLDSILGIDGWDRTVFESDITLIVTHMCHFFYLIFYVIWHMIFFERLVCLHMYTRLTCDANDQPFEQEVQKSAL